MPNANSFPDGRRGRLLPGDTSRVAAYAASTLPCVGPGMTSRRFPSGTTATPLRARRAAPAADFALYDASSHHLSGLWIGVKFGNVLPTSRSATLNPYPSDYTVENDYTYEFEVTADGSAWIQVDYDTSGATDKATDITMGYGTLVPVDDGGTDGSGANGYRVCGTWQVDVGVTPHRLKILGGAGANGIGSQVVRLCGGQFIWR